jgi:hypothetical protein
MSFFSKIVDKVKSVVHNVTETVINPVNTIKNSFLVGSMGAQGTAALVGPNATPKQAATITAVGAGLVYGGSLLLGPNLGIVPAGAVGASVLTAPTAVATAGSAAGASAVLPAAGGAVNSGLFDTAYGSLGLGKTLNWLANPGAPETSGSTSSGNSGVSTMGIATIPTGMKWVLGIGGALLVLWLILFKR